MIKLSTFHAIFISDIDLTLALPTIGLLIGHPIHYEIEDKTTMTQYQNYTA